MEYKVSPNGWICTFLELKERLSKEYQLDVKSPELITMIWEGFKSVEIASEEDRKIIQEKYRFIYQDAIKTGFWDMLVQDTSDFLVPGDPRRLRYRITDILKMRSWNTD